MANQLRLLFGVVLAFFVAGCGAKQTVASPSQAYRFQPAALTVAPPERGSRPEQILVLSGGGSFGAWGAGVLCGWSTSDELQRPLFDRVTGISTGSLMATAAFLGEPFDENLKSAYTNTRTRDIYRTRCILFALFGDSLLDTKPLRATIARSITDSMIDRVGEEARAGRRLVVGSVSLRSGELVLWDLTAIASDRSNPGRYDLYRQVLLASAAIPVAFPPVQIGDETHVDGGAHSMLFLRESVLDPLPPFEAGGRPPKPTIWVIVNGRAKISEKQNVKRKLLPIALRSVESLMSSSTRGALLEIKEIARTSGLDVRMCVPPDDAVDSMDSNEFDPVQMRQLFNRGFDAGQAAAWTPLETNP